jgi:hypothetical protein
LIGSYVALTLIGGGGVLIYLVREIFSANDIVLFSLTAVLVAWTFFISLSNLPFQFNSSVFIFLDVLLWIITIVMYRIISKTSVDPLQKALYLVKLKFTRLTFALSTMFFFIVLYIVFFVVVIAFPGELSWEVLLLAPFGQFLLLFLLIFVIFVGLTNWEGFGNICCFLPKKMMKILVKSKKI